MATIEEQLEDLTEKVEDIVEKVEDIVEKLDDFTERFEELGEQREAQTEVVEEIHDRIRELTEEMAAVDKRRDDEGSLSDTVVEGLRKDFESFRTETLTTLNELRKRVEVIDQTQFEKLMDEWMKSRNPFQKSFQENTDAFIDKVMEKIKSKLGG